MNILKKMKMVMVDKLSIRSNRKGEQLYYQYSTRDIVNERIKLHANDLVLFDIFIEKKAKEKGATNIRIIQFANQQRYHGIVIKLLDNYGFIKSIGNPITISEQNNKHNKPAQQQEEEEEVAEDGSKKKKKKINILLIMVILSCLF